MPPIYEKPVHALFKDFVNENHIEPGKKITRDDIISWFHHNYPKIKLGTISAHILRMSVNAPSRVHYGVRSNGDDDLFFQIDSSHFRLYNPSTDPTPIYIKEEAGNIGGVIENNYDELCEDESEFAYESDLRDFLSKNLGLLEQGLSLYKEEEGITGIEYPVGGRFIDILAKDSQSNYVVIELKVSRGYDRVVGQLLRYVAWIEENLAENGKNVKGIIVAREITEDLRLAASRVPDIRLFEYNLSVKVKEVEKQRR